MSFFKRIYRRYQPHCDDVTLNWLKESNIVFGPTTRNLLSIFEKHDKGTGKLDRKSLNEALNGLDLYPTKTQVYEMVKVGSECSHRKPEDHVTFGEFCIFATELIEQYEEHKLACLSSEDTSYAYTQPPARPPFLSYMSSFQVFLGGSCNPTTWRRDIAIPLLKQYGLTYYNPQVEEWDPHLIEVEEQAKQLAQLLLFVIDNTTRSAASLVEAAYLAGNGRQVILVIKGIPEEVAGEILTQATSQTPVTHSDYDSQCELSDLTRAHHFLVDLVQRQCLPIFDDIETAVHCAAKVINQGIPISALDLKDGAQPVRYPNVRVGQKLINTKCAFKEFHQKDVSKISIRDSLLALKSLHHKDFSFPAYWQIEESSRFKHEDEKYFDFNEFCCLATEYRNYEQPMHPFARIYSMLQGSLNGVMSRWSRQSQPCVPVLKRDVYLGGTCRNTTWREEITIPLLRNNGLSSFNPQLTEWDLRYIAIEAEAKENSEYMLYVIGNSSRGIASMVEVAYYVGQCRKLVLCVQNLQYGLKIEGEQLTDRAITDYNRARQYLVDVVSRCGIPILDDIATATVSLIEKIQAERALKSQ
ncbi:uncharacterized protein LOC117102335 isoform X2 [Anneissia japonica]|uniref:uncharacterized protein LOC117102335 isoform X2 n=1 Tax=Anneissia japonica TaxID=1529436 RepID=UPI0014256C46|nr:uncharacterized protein LOC117102335 isoform X2 [Anneissia japonica]